MNKMDTTVVAVALDGLYEVWRPTNVDLPSDVEKVLDLLNHGGLDLDMVIEDYDVSVVANQEGDVLDIRLNHESIGYHAVCSYCRVAEVKVPASLGQFEIGSHTLETFIEDNTVYLLPLFGEEA